VDVVGDVLKDGAAGSEVARGAEADLGDARGMAGGWGRHGVPMRTDRAWRTGRDRLLSILGGWDGTDCMGRAVAVLGGRSVPGVVRWPTKALSIVVGGHPMGRKLRRFTTQVEEKGWEVKE